jgi:hypothetical protein
VPHSLPPAVNRPSALKIDAPTSVSHPPHFLPYGQKTDFPRRARRKALQTFYPQGVRGIRKAAKLLTAAQAAAHGGK